MYQDHLLYFPTIPGHPKSSKDNQELLRSPSEHNIPFEEKFLIPKSCMNADGKGHGAGEENVKIHTWLLLQKNSEKVPTIVYFHGSAGNMGMRLYHSRNFYYRLGLNVMMVDYRGYGDSEG